MSALARPEPLRRTPANGVSLRQTLYNTLIMAQRGLKGWPGLRLASCEVHRTGICCRHPYSEPFATDWDDAGQRKRRWNATSSRRAAGTSS